MRSTLRRFLNTIWRALDWLCRLDFPDSDAGRMYESMQKLRRLADDTVIYAGHNYGGHVTHIANEKRHGALAAISESQWLGRINPDAG